jgi:predicted XRE-type DNA-binding protein
VSIAQSERQSISCRDGNGLGNWLADSGMTQTEAAKVLAVTQARVSDILLVQLAAVQAWSGLVLITGCQHARSQEAFGSHHMEDEDAAGILAVEDTARRLDDLSISPSPKLRRLRSASRMIDQLINMMKDALDQDTRCVRIL